MRIVDRGTFLALPEGTLYYKYKPEIFEELSIKGGTCGNDFVCLPLNDIVEANDSCVESELLEAGEKGGADIPIAFDNFGRDGMFDPDQLFAVLSKEEAKRLVLFLMAEVL